MSEHITHIAVAEDSARLATLSPDYSSHFRYAQKQFPKAVRYGSCTRSGDQFIVPLLKKWREDWQDQDPRSEKLAYIIGWQGHLAGDRTFKPTYRITDLAHYTRNLPSPSLASVYQDAATFHHVFEGGERAPYHPAFLSDNLREHPAGTHVPVKQLEPLYGYRFSDQAARLRHFSKEGRTDDWPERFDYISGDRQRYYIQMSKYTEAVETPDPSRQRRYLLAPNFYNPEDPILQLAQQLRMGAKPSIDLEKAAAEASQQSLYAQSLALGYQFYTAASDFFEGRIDEETARERLRTGQRHKESLKYYIELANQDNND